MVQGTANFEMEYAALIDRIGALDLKQDPIGGEVKKEKLLDQTFDLIRSPSAATVNDKAAHLVQLADILNKVDPA